jgi:chaperonin GroEL (HSP60 family)
LQLFENNGKEPVDTTNVYDATLVISNAVKNAVSLAGIILTTGADIRLRERTKEEQEIEILTLKNRPF